MALSRESTRLCRPLGGLLRPGPAAPLRLGPPREGELETAEKHPSLRASDAAVHALKPVSLRIGQSPGNSDEKKIPPEAVVGFFIIQILKALALIKADRIYPVSCYSGMVVGWQWIGI